MTDLAQVQDAAALADALAQRCEKARRHGDTWQACCPSHDDTTPSLKITPSDDRVLLKCFAGCAAEAIVAALGLRMQDLYVTARTNGHRRIVAVYPYPDANGHVVHETVRYAPKDFRQRRPDPANPGEYIPNLKGIEPVLYNLPAVLAAIQAGEVIHLAEGEKDAETLKDLGLVGTTVPMGAKYWRKSYTTTLTGAQVVVWPDNDKAGHDALAKVQHHLTGTAATLRVVTVPAPHKDVSDWVQAGATQADLEALVQAATPFEISAFLAQLHDTEPADRLQAVLTTIDGLATVPLADWVATKRTLKTQVPELNLNDLERLRTAALQEARRQAVRAAREAMPAWQQQLLCNAGGEPQQTIRNLVLAIDHLDPWQRDGCWYDLVRERHMVGATPVKDGDDTAAAVLIEQALGMRITNVALVGRALDHACRQTPRDLLREWIDGLATVPVSDLLTGWLRTVGNVPDTVSDAYVGDVSRLIPLGMVARILDPGCQFRYVAVLIGPEEGGKSNLTKALAGHDPYGCPWHVALSATLEGKEAHMMLQGALIAELEEFSSYHKTTETRMKALVTAQTDSFVPKFSNKRADHPRRTVFIATVNPEGDGAIFSGQSGNTRYFPIEVGAIDLPRFLTVRTQLFAEAKAYYLAHPTDWWHLACPEDAAVEREERRQTSIYQDDLGIWLAKQQYTTVWWGLLAAEYLELPREKWKDRATQMELTKALFGLGWRKGKRERIDNVGLVVPWRKG